MESQGLNDKSIMIILAIIFLLTQIVYFLISKSSTNKVIDKLSEIMKDLSPYFDRTRNMENVLNDLKHQHEAVDLEGKPLIYYPPSMSANQKEILSLALKTSEILKEVSTMQKEMREDIKNCNEKVEAKISTHSDTCKEQFQTIDRKFDKVLEGK